MKSPDPSATKTCISSVNPSSFGRIGEPNAYHGQSIDPDRRRPSGPPGTIARGPRSRRTSRPRNSVLALDDEPLFQSSGRESLIVASVDPQTLYCWCPEYTIQQVMQPIFIVFEGEARPIGTDFVCGNIDEAEEFCEKMNVQLQLDTEQAERIASTYIRETRDGAPILLRSADFKPWNREQALEGLDQFLPAFEEVATLVSSDPAQRNQANAEMVADVAQMFDNLASQAGDNSELQAQHLNDLKANPENWSDSDFRIHRFRIFRAEEHLRYLQSVQEQLTDLRNRATTTYQTITGEPLALTPDFTSAGPSLVSAETGEPLRG